VTAAPTWASLDPMTAPPIHGGFDEPEMHHILERACATTGLDSTGAILLRGHTNAVMRLTREPVVVKIARRGSRLDEVQRTVQFVRWLMDRGFPTVPLHPVADQPVVIDGHPVTFWTYLPQPEHPVSAAQIAKPLYALHTLPVPPFQLLPRDNAAAIRASLTQTPALPEETVRFLSQRVDRLEADLADVAYVLPEAVLQGDPQHRNALHDGDQAVLCDWDTVAVGQPEWDLVTIEVHCRRFGHGPRHYQEFAETYGYDVTAWPGYPVLRDLRELRMITTNAKKVSHNPGSLAEVQRRIDGLRHEDTDLPWRIL
jgi:hypothetical protein